MAAELEELGRLILGRTAPAAAEAVLAAGYRKQGAALRHAADYLEIRMDQSDPGSYAEQQYQAGYADAVARLILFAEGKAL